MTGLLVAAMGIILMKIKGDAIILSTGRKICANKGIVGICPKGDIYSGYDGIIHIDGWADETVLTNDELMEIAAYMVSRWKESYAECKKRQLKRLYSND